MLCISKASLYVFRLFNPVKFPCFVSFATSSSMISFWRDGGVFRQKSPQLIVRTLVAFYYGRQSQCRVARLPFLLMDTWRGNRSVFASACVLLIWKVSSIVFNWNCWSELVFNCIEEVILASEIPNPWSFLPFLARLFMLL